ncbi:MAG TPA: N-acetylglucosamine-6-phosphate deacetylase [Acidobacteriaceae bacterium]|nr:N-acetylglucosamine-6-phosphate deacetylase [Acidobacteriaceae bacterium]
MRTTLTAARLIGPEKVIENPVVVIEDGVIASIAPRTEAETPAGKQLDFAGCTVTAAYFDVHCHGSAGHDVMEATPEAFATIGKFLASHGVGAYLPTTVTMPKDITLKSLEGMAKLVGKHEGGPRAMGIHIEGLFLSPKKKGAHPERLLLTPSVEFFDKMWEASAGTIKLMTIAPELPNALEVIARATSLGVRMSMGHSNANADEAKAGVKAGAASATHTYNAMRNFDHRAPGLLGEVLTNDELFAEVICDGFHVDPAAVEIYWKCKGPERAILITDAMVAAGMPDGKYKLGELDVQVIGGKCVLEGDTLAGSTLTLDRGVRNFAKFTGASIDAAARLASRNPARMTGLDGEVGVLAAGRTADITVLSAEHEVVATILRGEQVGVSTS